MSLIGASEQKGGLYYFRRIPTVCAVVAVSGLTTFELCLYGIVVLDIRLTE